MRYFPPRLSVPPEFDWLLVRAYGPREAESRVVGRLKAKSLISLGRRLSLLARIGVRNSPEIVGLEAGPDVGREVSRAVVKAAALGMRNEQTCIRLAEICSETGVPVMFLKGMALLFQGRSDLGSRWIGDVDVLLRGEEAKRLHAQLLGLGWQHLDVPAEAHHLSPLVDEFGTIVDLHTSIRGVRVNNRLSVGLEECLEESLTYRFDPMGDCAFVPSKDLLAAHLLTHAVGQHGSRPDTYPMLKILGDLQDLGMSGRGGEEFCDRCAPWVLDEISREELDGIVELLNLLETNVLPSEITATDSNASSLLRHVIAGLSDDDYRLSLKYSRSWEKSGDGGRLVFSLQGLIRAVFLTRGQIDLIYGTQKSPFGYLFRQLWRPFDLVGRTWSSAMAWRRVHKRENSGPRSSQ